MDGGRDTPINGGVYLGGGKREAIVVDDTAGPRGKLDGVYQELVRLRERALRRGEHFKQTLLSDVFDLVKARIPYSEGATREVAVKLKIGADQPVHLDKYIEQGGGVCRHQALLAAYLLERLGKEGKVGGRVSVDRNYVRGLGGHAWARYTNSAGQVVILDPARDLIKSLEEVNPDIRSFYERPERRRGFIARLLGH